MLACLHNPNCFCKVNESLAQAVACLAGHPNESVPLLRSILHDLARYAEPFSGQVAVQAASRFPQLTDDLVACLDDPEIISSAGDPAFVASLACLFGLIDVPTVEWVEFEEHGEDPTLWSRVEAELKRRYGRVPAALNVFTS